MPTMTTKRGKKVCVGSVTVERRRKQKMFPPTKKGVREAVLWEEQERKRMLEEIEDERSPTIRSDCLTVLDWANEYLKFAQSRFAAKTFQEKRSAFKLMIGFAGADSLISDISPSNCLAFLSIQNDKRSGYAANKDRKNLSAAWDWGLKYMDNFPKAPNPFQAVERFPEKRKPRYVPPEEDFWTVFSMTKGQDKAMLATFLYLAARRGEVFLLTLSDIDWKNDQIRLWTRKRKGGTME